MAKKEVKPVKEPKRAPRQGEGRPSGYTPEVLQKTRDYLTIYSSLGHAVPSVAGLAVHLGLARSTIYEWSADSEKKEFADILSKILAEQEQVALSNGLTGEYNATIVKLLLGKHGYSDKAETQTTVTLENMSDDELNARIQSLLPR